MKSNKPYEYGKISLSRLCSTHIDLQVIWALVINRSSVDISIIEGHRSIKKQQEYYAIGRSVEVNRRPITNIDGIHVISKHNEMPSMAVDFCAYHSDKLIRNEIAYNQAHLSYIYGLVDSCAKELYEKGMTTHLTRWGGNWDRDGILFFDQNLDDAPHVELYKP